MDRATTDIEPALAREYLRVLVLGGRGFIGRHAVAALLAAGAKVAIGSRYPHRIVRRLPAGAECEAVATRFENMTSPDAWDCVEKFDAVLNCVGILRERGTETYERVHHRAPVALAEACRRCGIPLLHVSALGLHEHARSGFLRSKLRAERALLDSGADVRIVRPSLLDGEGGFGARWLRALARLPVLPMPADARGRIAVLDVRDLGEALAVLASKAAAGSSADLREIELGGPHASTLREHLASLRRLRTPRPALALSVPGWLARAASHFCDLLHLSPFSFGHWELLRHDNVPHCNLLPELLGRAPRPVGAPAPVTGAATAQPLAAQEDPAARMQRRIAAAGLH